MLRIKVGIGAVILANGQTGASMQVRSMEAKLTEMVHNKCFGEGQQVISRPIHSTEYYY